MFSSAGGFCPLKWQTDVFHHTWFIFLEAKSKPSLELNPEQINVMKNYYDFTSKYQKSPYPHQKIS